MRQLAAVAAALVAGAGCKSGKLAAASGVLALTADGGTLQAPDAGLFVLDFGQVLVGDPVTVAIAARDIGATPLTIVAVTPLTSDPALALLLPPGPVSGGLAGSASFTPQSEGPKVARFKLQTDSTLVPTILLQLEGTGVVGSLAVAPNPVDFGAVVANQTVLQTLKVTNNSAIAAPIFVSPPTSVAGEASYFKLDPPSPAVVPAGQTAMLTAHFSPLLPLPGELEAFVDVAACAGCASVKVALKGSVLSTGLTATPSPLAFGFVQPGTSRTLPLHLQNIGNVPVTLQLPAINPGPLTPSWSLTPDAGLAFPLVLDAGSSADLAIDFAPRQLAAYSGQLQVGFADSVSAAQTLTVPLGGFGGGAQVSCLPPSLDFGPVVVAAGNGVAQLLVCTNTGSVIPGHPEANLFLQAPRVSDGGPFSAAFQGLPPDGGLVAGQSQILVASYAPIAVGSDNGTLTISTNDPQRGQRIPLSGRGISPQNCQVAVSPAPGLNFGEVLPGTQQQLQFAISNIGSAPCVVQNLQLAASSAPAFSLPGGRVASQQLSFSGDGDNPNGNPVTFPVSVEVAPAAAGALTGAVTFDVLQGSPASESVPLTAQSHAGCLSIQPSSLDFGVVTFDSATGAYCATSTREVVVANTCATPLTVSGFTETAGLSSSPQFRLDNAPTPPFALAGGASVSFQVAFKPTSAGSKAAALQLTTGEFAVPYLVSLLGQAVASGTRTDHFVATPPKADLLMVWDDDDDAYDQSYTAPMAAGLSLAIDAGVDFHVAITSTDVCPGTYSDQGSLEPCGHCLLNTSNQPTILTSSPTLGADFVNFCNQFFGALGNSSCGATELSAYPLDEYFLEAAYEALDPVLLNGHNAGFLRPDAQLVILAINGDEEDDHSPSLLTTYFAAYQAVKLDPSQVTIVLFIDGNSAVIEPETTLTAATQLTNGSVINVQAPGAAGQIADLFAHLPARGIFTLTTQPVAATLRVQVNGVEVPANSNTGAIWSFNPTANAVVFATAPPAGAVVDIAYQVTCG